MSYDEAVHLGLQYCQGRGYGCQVKEAHLTGKNVWKVKLRVVGGLKGHVHLDYDAHSRTLLRVNEKVKERRGRGHKGRDYDDDD